MADNRIIDAALEVQRLNRAAQTNRFEYGNLVEILDERSRWEGQYGTVIHQKGSLVSVSVGDDEVAHFYTYDLVKVGA